MTRRLFCPNNVLPVQICAAKAQQALQFTLDWMCGVIITWSMPPLGAFQESSKQDKIKTKQFGTLRLFSTPCRLVRRVMPKLAGSKL